MYTVTELRKMFEDLEADGHGNLYAKFAYGAGDYWRTTVADSISNVAVAKVEHSDYHGKDKVLDEDDMDAEKYNTAREVVIIS